jgi:hypothetical protein
MRKHPDQPKAEQDSQLNSFVGPVGSALFPNVLNPQGLMPSPQKIWKPEAKQQWRQDSFL